MNSPFPSPPDDQIGEITVVSTDTAPPSKRSESLFTEVKLPPDESQLNSANSESSSMPAKTDSTNLESNSTNLTSDSTASANLSANSQSNSTTSESDSTISEGDSSNLASASAAQNDLESPQKGCSSTNFLPAVEFFPPPGAATQGSLTLELRAALPDGAQIRYALSADDVGAEGALYEPSQKIFLGQSASVAARIFAGNEVGPLSKAQFEIVQPGWQKIEPLDPSDPSPHEISDQNALEGAWQLAGASVRGKLHAHRGFWREDSYAHGLANAADGSYSIVIVSDGAGSANLSRVGSKLLCEVALNHLRENLVQSAPLSGDQNGLVERDLPLLRALLVEAASLALQKLREEADRRARPLSDFSSTLLILLRREWNGQQLCAALQSGDGAIALWNDDNTLTLLGEADHGEHSSETKFLTTSGMEAELPARVKFSIRPDLKATAVMSDGVADDFFPETVRLPELFGQILPLAEKDAPNAGVALLEWIKYEKKGSSDDRALVLCWRAQGEKSEMESTDGAL